MQLEPVLTVSAPRHIAWQVVEVVENIPATLLAAAPVVLRSAGVRLHLPVGAHHLLGKDFARELGSGCRAAALSPASVSLELHLAAPIISTPQLEANILALRSMGVRVGLLGFGEGYSSLVALKTFQVDHLELCASVVPGSMEPGAWGLLPGMMAGLRELGTAVQVRGVTSLAQLEPLLRAGVISARGPVWAGPMDVSQALHWVSPFART